MLIRQIPWHPRALKSALDESRDGGWYIYEGPRGYSFVNGVAGGGGEGSTHEAEQGVRIEGGRKDGREDTQEAVVAVLVGDEANMHALDPAKVHLDRIALHYSALQWCSIPWRDRREGRTRNRQLPSSSFTASPCDSLTFRPLAIGSPCSFPLQPRRQRQHMLNNLRGTSGLELYRELYHTCAYILVYVDTSLLLGEHTWPFTRRKKLPDTCDTYRHTCAPRPY